MVTKIIERTKKIIKDTERVNKLQSRIAIIDRINKDRATRDKDLTVVEIEEADIMISIDLKEIDQRIVDIMLTIVRLIR